MTGMKMSDYTLRGLMNNLEAYIQLVLILNIDYSKKILLTNSIRKRINLIKEYLNEDIIPPKKLSINQIFLKAIKDMDKE